MSNLKTTTPSGTLEERLTYYSSEALPNSIRNISENSKNLTPVIEYLEQAYLTAPDQQTQADVETQAKTYLVDALMTVVGDINTIAHNLEQCVGLQVDAVDGLATQMELLKTKMALYKEQHGSQKLRMFKDPVATTSGTYSRKVDEDSGGSAARLGSVLLPSVHLMEAVALSAAEEKAEGGGGGRSKRVPLHDRLARLDDVGICLDKEEGKQSAKASAMASSSVLRRSSYNKQNPNGGRRTSQHTADDDDCSVMSGPPDDDDVSVSSQGSRMKPPPRLSAAHH